MNVLQVCSLKNFSSWAREASRKTDTYLPPPSALGEAKIPKRQYIFKFCDIDLILNCLILILGLFSHLYLSSGCWLSLEDINFEWWLNRRGGAGRVIVGDVATPGERRADLLWWGAQFDPLPLFLQLQIKE